MSWLSHSFEQKDAPRVMAERMAEGVAIEPGPAPADSRSGEPYRHSDEHLWHALAWVEQLVRAQTERWRHTIAAHKPAQLWGMVHVTDAEVTAMLECPFTTPHELPAELQACIEPHWRAAATMAGQVTGRERATGPEVTLRVVQLGKLFGLGTLERAALLLCLLPELDARYRRLFGYLQDDASRSRPTIELLQQMLLPLSPVPETLRAVFDPDASLVQHRLLVPAGDARSEEPLSVRPLRVDDRIADFVLGSNRPDGRLRPLVTEPGGRCDPVELVVEPGLAERLDSLVRHLTAGTEPHPPPVLFFRGSYGTGRRLAARIMAQSLDRPVLLLDVPAALQARDPWPLLVDLALREAVLRDAVLYWQDTQALLEPDRSKADWRYLLDRVEAHPGLVVLASTLPWDSAGRFDRRAFLRYDFPAPSYALRRQAWMAQLPNVDSLAASMPERGHLAAVLANGFQLTPGQITDAVATARGQAMARHPQAPEITLEDLYAGCRRQSGHGLVTYARLIEPRTGLTFDDLILPAANDRQLQELRNRIRYHSQVFAEMGFERRLTLGRGLIALFTGSSGTGKTMAAELLGREHGMQLYKVDLAAVVSKYVGETEKNLAQVFREAEDGNAILFFDEGEALFGKRGEVKEARDRWANIEVNYLLQRVEEYAGVVILTTNFRQNMDPGFLRRIHVTVDFPRPDAAARLKIWRGMFPQGVERPADEELRHLAEQFNLVGGNIKNAVLDAAFRALSEGSAAISLRHLVLGIAREQQKLGNALTRGDFGVEFHDWIAAEIL